MHTLTPAVCCTGGFNHDGIGGLILDALITPESKHFHTPVSVIFQRCRCCVMHSRSANGMPHCGAAACLLNSEVAPVGLSCFDGPLLGDVCVCVVRRVNMAPLVAFADCLSPTCLPTRLPTAHKCSQTHLPRSPCILTRFLLKKPFVHVDFSGMIVLSVISCTALSVIVISVCFTKVAVIIA